VIESAARVALASLVLAVAAVGCGASSGPGSSSGSGTGTGTGSMVVTGAFVPEPPGAVAALYFTVANGTGRDDRLVGVATDIADEAQLHETVIDGERVTMGSKEHVDVPEGDVVTFAPAGLHVMLVGVQPVREGDEVEVVLRFEHAMPVAVRVPVGALGSTEPPSLPAS
jgi:periplasmic copper chaperone A